MKGSDRLFWFAVAAVVIAAAAVVLPPKYVVTTERARLKPEANTSSPEAKTSQIELPAFTPPPPPTTQEMEEAAVFTPEFPGADGGPALLPPLPLQRGELEWERRLRSVTERTNLAEAEKARLLLEMLPSLPVEGRQTATEEAVKRLPNSEYRHAHRLVTSAGTYGLSLSVLFTDLMERPPEITLPTLLQIARTPQHPFADAARENLEFFIGKDFSTDWNRWDAAIREKLAAKR